MNEKLKRLTSERVNVQKQLNQEWLNYRTALNSGKEYNEQKKIWLQIKEMQKKMNNITNEIDNLLNSGN